MADFSVKSTVSISCPKLLSDYLQSEIVSAGFKPLKVRSTGIDIYASLNDCIALNMNLRTAHRVHYLLGEKPVSTPDELYYWLKTIPWEEYIDKNGFFSVTSRINHPSINNTQFANLKCKDAIADRIREKTGSRPDSGADLTKTVVFLFWNNHSARIFMDTSGESVSRRGYRVENVEAPMQESLAAGILMASGWDGNSHLINPMCGSGTLAIEAALMALNRESGARRRNFGFMHIKGYDREEYKKIRIENRQKWKKSLPFQIVATDNDLSAVNAARANITAAGLEDVIRVYKCDFSETEIPDGKGAVVMNPPYGQRLGNTEDLGELYTEIGSFLKKNCAGKTGLVFTGDPKLAGKIGLRASAKIPFYNSTIECRLLMFDIFEGKAKDKGE